MTLVQRWDSHLGKRHRNRIRDEAQLLMAELQAAVAEAGISRPWIIKDMILQPDPVTHAVRPVVPVDWERVKLDFDRLRQAPVARWLHELARPEKP